MSEVSEVSESCECVRGRPGEGPVLLQSSLSLLRDPVE